jgi:hypothetical protein
MLNVGVSIQNIGVAAVGVAKQYFCPAKKNLNSYAN